MRRRAVCSRWDRSMRQSRRRQREEQMAGAASYVGVRHRHSLLFGKIRSAPRESCHELREPNPNPSVAYRGRLWRRLQRKNASRCYETHWGVRAVEAMTDIRAIVDPYLPLLYEIMGTMRRELRDRPPRH